MQGLGWPAACPGSPAGSVQTVYAGSARGPGLWKSHHRSGNDHRVAVTSSQASRQADPGLVLTAYSFRIFLPTNSFAPQTLTEWLPKKGAQSCPWLIAWHLLRYLPRKCHSCTTNPPFHFLFWKDVPSVQPFQAEERGKQDELQGPEFQACEQTTLAQSTCPGKEGLGGCGVCDTYVSICVHVVCVHVVSAVWYVHVLCV